MLLIQESNTRRNTFDKYIIDKDTGKKQLLKTVKIRSIHKSYAKRDYSILYNSNMVPIIEGFEFINYEFLTSSPNTKSQAISALRLLYSFLELFDLKLESLTDEDIRNLKYFLRGFSPKGSFITIDLSTDRSNNTINTYLAIYRKYADFLNIEDSNLKKVSPITSKAFLPQGEFTVENKIFIHNERVNKNKTVPRYISVSEYKKILKVIDDKYSLREKCIVRLMFEGGLRIGEILGLTGEDIKIEDFLNKRDNTTFTSGVIYIRNRITDKDHQLAKRRMVVTSRRTYSTKLYKNDTTKVFISVELVDLISDYINDTHDSSNRKSTDSKKLFDKNYKKYTVTDIVDKKGNIDDEGLEILDENYYIFINSIGKPVDISTWNKMLRKIFDECNIRLDKDKREHNLNHRFRHGFAMFLVQYKKINIEDLMRLMRHTSISSTAVYYRPTDDDVALLKEDFSKTLEELIPIVTERSFDEVGI